MTFNKHIITVALWSLCVASGSALAAATDNSNGMTANPVAGAGTQSTGGVVHFTGKITDISCDVSPDAKDQTIDLGTWAKSYFASQVETTRTPFSIKVENCPESVKKVAVLFDGERDAKDNTLLKISKGDAEGIGIKLYEEDRSTQVKLGTVSKNQDIEGEGDKRSKELRFFADYRADGNDIKAGDANADANFLMVYN